MSALESFLFLVNLEFMLHSLHFWRADNFLLPVSGLSRPLASADPAVLTQKGVSRINPALTLTESEIPLSLKHSTNVSKA